MLQVQVAFFNMCWWLMLQAFHKSHLLKLRVAPSETAMTDVLREVCVLCLFMFLLETHEQWLCSWLLLLSVNCNISLSGNNIRRLNPLFFCWVCILYVYIIFVLPCSYTTLVELIPFFFFISIATYSHQFLSLYRRNVNYLKFFYHTGSYHENVGTS